MPGSRPSPLASGHADRSNRHTRPPVDLRSHNLPAPLSPLVGRTREVAAVVALLRREGARLVTLTGPGGVGKTRLALAVATELVEDFADGVRFVPLAPAGDRPEAAPELVASTIAQALGLREAGRLPSAERLRQELGDRQLLLVLDGFEPYVSSGTTATCGPPSPGCAIARRAPGMPCAWRRRSGASG